MLALERRTKIVELLAQKSSISIRDLTECLGVSRETVRKDIDLLSRQGKLHQVRGGAVRVLEWEPPIADRLRTNPEGKAAISQMVAARIPDNASVIIDSGSTTLVAAERLAAVRHGLTVYTNDLKIALTMGSVAKEVILLGGRLDPRENAVFGLEAIEHLSRYRADFSLIGCAGFTVKGLLTDFSRETSALRECMMARAERAMVLADSSKFQSVGAYTMALGPNVSVLCDEAPDEELAQALNDAAIPLELPA